MISHTEKRHVPYTSQQMYDLVIDVARYPTFLPWVVAARIKEDNQEFMIADILVGFNSIREQFRSKVDKQPYAKITVDYLSGPLQKLHTEWHFSDSKDGGCDIEFHVAFAFKSKVFQTLVGKLFHRAMLKMTRAFITRADIIYNDKRAALPH